MAEQRDVVIVGSGFGGSIAAWRLAELYTAAGVRRDRILVLERGRRFKHTDFRQSMYVGHLANIYNLIQSFGVGTPGGAANDGGQVVVGNGVGGGSNVYLAASLRSPFETFERRDHHPDDGPARRMWPKPISRRTLTPYYGRVERALRVNRPSWDQVSKAGGLWAATLAAAGHTCDRVPIAISPDRCVDANWCHTGCIFGAKNTVTTNYLAAAERAGVAVRPNRQVESVRRAQANAAGYRYVVTASVMDNEGPSPTRAPTGASEEIECRVLIMAAGAMGTPPILMRSRDDLPSLSNQLGRHLGVNGDHVAGVEYDERKVRDLLGLPGYRDFHKGKPITTMTYDFWAGRRAHRFDGTRFTIQEIFLSTLTNFLYDDGRGHGEEPSFWGLEKKRAISNYTNRIELLAMVEDTHDGSFQAPPPQGAAFKPNAGPIVVGTHTYNLSEQSIRVREAANRAMKGIVERRGLARFMKISETRGVYAAHPLGGCRMADSKEYGVVDHGCEAFDNEGLFCMDSSAIPTSLGVNPSLTISAVAERAVARLVQRAGDYGLPKAPKGLRHWTPGQFVGPRVRPRRRPRAAVISAAITALAALALVPGASAEGPIAPYDGTNPFRCTLQQLGTGTDFRDPTADPLCVEYDKTHQSVAEGGLVQFLSMEPARVAAAGPTCFYFQRDHWTGYVSEADGRTQTYHWDGSYWFDKSTGEAGGFMERLSLNGQLLDATLIPGFPEDLKPYFSNGRGGITETGAVPVDPSCATLAAKIKPRDKRARPATACLAHRTRLGLATGALHLGMRRRAIGRGLPKPRRSLPRALAFCVRGGGQVVAVFDRRGRNGRVRFLRTSSPTVRLPGTVRARMRAAAARRRLRDERPLARGVLIARTRQAAIVVRLASGRVRWAGLAARRTPAARLRFWLPPR